MTLWLIIIGIGIITYATRLSFILIFGQMDMPAPLQRALRFVPAAALSAIIFPALVLSQGNPDLSLSNTRLLAGILAAVVAWYTRNALLTIIVGMVGLWLLQALLG